MFDALTHKWQSALTIQRAVAGLDEFNRLCPAACHTAVERAVKRLESEKRVERRIVLRGSHAVMEARRR